MSALKFNPNNVFNIISEKKEINYILQKNNLDLHFNCLWLLKNNNIFLKTKTERLWTGIYKSIAAKDLI